MFFKGSETNVKPAKEKRSERRKEKSRDAARCRRSKESEIFSDLAQVLPLPPSTVAHLDKASIMRLVISHLRIRNMLKGIPEDDLAKLGEHDDLYLKALGGMVLVLSLDGDIAYVSNNVCSLLGVSQVDLLGHSIYDVSHPCDHTELRDLLCGKVPNEGSVSLFLRLKCTLNSKGRSVNLKSASYKVLHINGRFVKMEEGNKESLHFVSIGTSIPHPVNIETPLGSYTFLSMHSLDMKFTYADERMSDFLGYEPEDLIGKSLYKFHHVEDNKGIQKAFKSLFAKGQAETGCYRFLARGGGYVWVSTQATVIYNDKGHNPVSVVCVNYVMSEKYNEVDIYSSDQLEWVQNHWEEILCLKESPESVKSEPKSLQSSPNPSARPQPATAKIFAPRTEEMNTGFLTYKDGESNLTMMKEEPEDLTHLAPTAGDRIVILPPLSQLNDLVLPNVSDGFSPLISGNSDNPLFASVVDDRSSGPLSPSLTQSPGGCSLPSLSSFSDDTPSYDETTSMKTLLGLDLDSNDGLSIKKSFLSLNDRDEFQYLSPLNWEIGFATNLEVDDNGLSQPILCLKQYTTLNQLFKPEGKCTSSKFSDHEGTEKSFFPETEVSEKRKRGVNVDSESNKKRRLQVIPGPDDGGGSNLLLSMFSNDPSEFDCFEHQSTLLTNHN